MSVRPSVCQSVCLLNHLSDCHLSVHLFICLPLQYLKERFKINMPHRFKAHSYFRPTFCDLCGQMMHGLLRQGVKCEGKQQERNVHSIPEVRHTHEYLSHILFWSFLVCGMNCHTRCAPNMPKMCGVNEKLLGEALKDVDQQKKSKSVYVCKNI